MTPTATGPRAGDAGTRRDGGSGMSAAPVSRTRIRCLAALDLVLPGDRGYLMLHSHMRSGSTLALHLLIANPEIAGYGEDRATYRSRRDLAVLAAHSRAASGPGVRGRARWAVDQINHDDCILDESILRHPRLRLLFLLREPRGTLASIVDHLGPRFGLGPKEAVDYYRSRLRTQAHYGEYVADPRRCAVFTYRDLTAATEPTLAGLSEFLGLRTPLSPGYELRSFTGRRGDQSERIRSGRIGEPLPPPAEVPGVPAATLAELDELHADVLSRLRRVSTVVAGSAAGVEAPSPR